MEVFHNDGYIIGVGDVFTPEECKFLIDKYDEAEEKHPPEQWQVRRAETVFLEGTHWKDACRMLVRPRMSEAIRIFIDNLYPGMHAPDWLDGGFIISKYYPKEYCTRHMDGAHIFQENGKLYQRMATFHTCLNTPNPEDPRDGAMRFPAQDLEVPAKAGQCTFFPAGYTHPHEVLPVRSERYIMVGWLYHPGEITEQVRE